jgi:NAD(P)-dependent dehydrogenase (short-subunit alcohol dehydrogenase family)
MDTNFFGPMALTRLVLPAMRKRRSGTVVNISSAAGIEAKASRTQYCASKFALEAFSESLYNEMKPFGVRVLIVEPGAFGSKFAQNVVLPKTKLPDDYKGSITEMTVKAVQNMTGIAPPPGDVEKGVQAIFDVVMKTGQADGIEEFIRLPLGKDNAGAWERKLTDLRRNLDGTEKIWTNTDHDN